jgi:hypothetical protein
LRSSALRFSVSGLGLRGVKRGKGQVQSNVGQFEVRQRGAGPGVADKKKRRVEGKHARVGSAVGAGLAGFWQATATERVHS